MTHDEKIKEANKLIKEAEVLRELHFEQQGVLSLAEVTQIDCNAILIYN